MQRFYLKQINRISNSIVFNTLLFVCYSSFVRCGLMIFCVASESYTHTHTYRIIYTRPNVYTFTYAGRQKDTHTLSFIFGFSCYCRSHIVRGFQYFLIIITIIIFIIIVVIVIVVVVAVSLKHSIL